MNPFLQKYGPWALITGASAGIGSEFAQQLASKGLNLILVARRQELLQNLADNLESEYRVSVRSIALDLSRTDLLSVIEPLTYDVEVGLLVNNAGVMSSGSFIEIDLEVVQQELDLNARAPMILTHHFAPKMVERKRGGIIFLSSMAAFQGVSSISHYAATKSYDLVFAEGLYAELKRFNVDVMAVAPGFTSTDMVGPLDFSGSPFSPMPASRVANIALDAIRYKSVVVPGGSNRFLTWLGKHWLSRRMNTAIFGRVFESLQRDPYVNHKSMSRD